MNETIDIHTLQQDNHNFNKGTDAGKKLMEKSFKELGAGRSILLDKDGRIIAGNKSQLAAIEAGITKVRIVETTGDELVAVKRTDVSLDEKKGRELAIADNVTTQINLSWDKAELEAVGEDIPDLNVEDWGLDLKDLGFDNQSETKDVKEDNFDEDKEHIESICQRGDIYQLGEHRLMCGDSTSAEDVALLMNLQSAELLFTSPPYSDMREYRGGKELAPDHLAHFIEVYSKYVRYQAVNLGLQTKDYEVFQYWDAYIDLAHNVDLKLLAWNVWDKTTIGSIGAQKQFFPLRHEWIFVFGKEPKKLNKYVPKKTQYDPTKKTRKVRKADGHMSEDPIGDCSNPFKTIESVLAITPEYAAETRHLHPAVFPVALPGEYIKSLTDNGDIVIEPFGGSGTTMIACEQLGRRCFAMELDPHYCDVIIARWEKFTGEKAVKL